MKFQCRVTYASDLDGSKVWVETYEEDVVDAEEWAKDTIRHFNNTLRPHEVARRLISVKVIDADSIKDHDWSKQNLYTLTSPQGAFDKVKCSRCGIVARRYGLARIVRQTPYRAKKFERCDSAMKALK